MQANVRIQRDGLAPDAQIEYILLTCAVLQSRQQMTAEVETDAKVEDAGANRILRTSLELLEESSIHEHLNNIRGLIQNPNDTPQGADHHGKEVTITDLEDHYAVRCAFDKCHATSPERTFQHVYHQIRHALPGAQICHISAIGDEDIAWLSEYAVKEIPPPILSDGASLFRACATKCPDKVAVEAWNGLLTYSELEKEADRLAVALQRRDVRPGTILPLVFEFSKWTLVSLLATWKARAAFAFLDPTHPTSRNQKLIKQVEATMILAQNEWPNFTPGPGVKILVLDAVLAEAKSLEENEVSSLPTVDPASYAYVVFTSGSTEKPKAAVHTHSAFCSPALHQAELLGYSDQIRTLQNAPLIFAGAIPELLFTVLRGGCLCIPKQEDRIQDLSGCVRRYQSNMLIISPSSAAVRDPATFSPRQRLIMGSEPLSTHVAKKWAALRDNCNAYGSTETNTVATCCAINTAESSQCVGSGAAHQY